MSRLSPDDLVRRLEWRYAVQKFDASRRIPPKEWDALERALVLTPSSWGLQPWRFLVVEDPALRERLVAASWDQRQVVEASHLVVFAIETELGPAKVERYLARLAQVRGEDPSSHDGLRRALTKFVSRPKARLDLRQWAALQVYIALGNFMTSAAVLGIDTCPMEGLDAAKYDEILGLAPRGLATVVACGAGYRAADDVRASLRKVRFAREDVVEHV